MPFRAAHLVLGPPEKVGLLHPLAGHATTQLRTPLVSRSANDASQNGASAGCPQVSAQIV